MDSLPFNLTTAMQGSTTDYSRWSLNVKQQYHKLTCQSTQHVVL